MGRLYVSTLTLLCSALLTLMVTVLTPLSLPTDIQQQTIYTVVSKPVRRLEMIWGRMFGYMALVTVLLVLFGGISLAYLWRTVGSTQRADAGGGAEGREGGPGRPRRSSCYEQAEQLYTRMTAREPIKGSLSFLDSRGMPHAMGIDVGQDVSTREPRSHIEGATPSAAIWSFGRVPDPFTPPGRQPRILNKVIPVDRFLTPGTLEWDLDRLYQLEAQINEAQQAKQQPSVTPTRIQPARPGDRPQPAGARAGPLRVRGQEAAVRRAGGQAGRGPDAGRKDEADALRQEIDQLHSRPVNLQMTFNVYRTTKGKIGEPVYAELDRDQPPHRRPVRARHLRDPRVLHQQGDAAGVDPGRLERGAADRGPLPQPDAVPRHGRERPVPAAGVGELRRQLHEGPLRHLAPGHGPDRHRRLRRDVPELAGGPADHHLLLRRRAARLQLPGRLHPPGDHGRRPVRVADPPADPRQPDERAGPDGLRRPRQDARLAGRCR